ncbi:MAG TPA: AMP-binding protein, partial [Archangium sp.]
GQPSPLPELPIQYADYAVWQRAQVGGEALQRELAYWKKQLVPHPPPLELPTDRPRPAVKSYRGAREFMLLPAELTRALKALSQREDATLFMTLLAAFKSVLHRYTGQKDIAVGSPIANRKLPEMELLIGFFVNTLVLRTELSGDPSFRELLQRVRRTCLEAYAHQDVPFEKLVEELQPERNLGRNPLFQVLFSFQNTPRQDLAVKGLTSHYLLVDPGTSKFDLLLELREERADEISGWFEYDTDLWDRDTVLRLRGHFLGLLERLAGLVGPAGVAEQKLSRLPILGESERRQVLVEWNATRTEYPREASLPALFEAQVARTPDAVAVVFGDEQLTYRALDVRANQLARRLRALGVGPEERVGLSVERSPDMVVGMLGILKAGGAYVPLDPAYPRERLAYMLEDSGARVLVTQAHLAHTLRREGLAVVCPDAQQEESSREDQEPVAHLLTGDNIAYAIYTSGSTGKPKGVLVPHRTVANFFTAMDARLEASPKRTWLAVTSISFDISVLELLWTLTRGFKVVLQSEEHALPSSRRSTTARKRPLDFSLFYFADDADATQGGDRYRLLMEGAKFADRNGFT